MDRRSFLNFWIDVPIVRLITRTGTANENNRSIASREYKNLVEKIGETNSSEYSKEQLFVNSNPRLNQSFSSKGYCYVIVHPGYATYDNNEVVQEAVKDVEKYGDYGSYLANILKLIKYLNNSDELVIFAIEKQDFHNKNIPKKELRPSNSAMIIITEDGYNTFEEYVNTGKDIEKQSSDLMFSFLKRNSVKEVRFAGEWTWWQGEGCLGGIVDEFDEDFKIKGIEGCIFPLIQSKETKILEKLYEKQIPLETILKK